MSVHTQFDETVAVQPRIEEVEAAPDAPAVPTQLVTIGSADSVESPAVAAETYVPPPVAAIVRRRPPWVVPASIAAVGLIASGTLGYFLYATIGQRDVARNQLVATQATLATSKTALSSAESWG